MLWLFSHVVVSNCDSMNCSRSGFPVLHHLPEFAQTHGPWVSDAIHPIILCRPLLILPSIFPRFRVFSNKLALFINQVVKVLEFELQHQSFHWIYRVDFLQDWLVWPCCSLRLWSKTLKGLLQHHSSKASVPWWPVFYMVQLSHPYMTTGKTIVLTI